MTTLIPPYGGVLVDLCLHGDELAELKRFASRLPSLHLSSRTVCDLELLPTGAFSPLDRSMGHGEYRRVLDEMRLTSGHLFPIPTPCPSSPKMAFARGARSPSAMPTTTSWP